MKKIIVFVLSLAMLFAFVPLAGPASAATTLKEPANVKATAATTTSVKITWSKVDGAKQYQVYQATGAKYKKVATTSKTTFTAKKLKKKTIYKFKVRAIKGTKKGSFSYIVKSKPKVTTGKRNVSSVTMSKKSATVTVGKTVKLTAKLKPTNVISKTIVWTSSNKSVATVSKGVVTGKKAGTCTIKARAHNGFTASCKITVKEEIKAVAPTGTYIGHDNKGVQEFLGISYAAPIERWKAPQPVTTTSADRIVCDEWGPSCIQVPDAVEIASQWTQSEDCLDLNVWTKDVKKTGKPVMVFFHGGGNWRGGTYDPLYHGDNFTRNLYEDEDVCFVTVNFRLGIFGSLNLSELEGYTDEYKDAINLTMLDQIQALKWVNENIEAFGGDKNNVTILGQSAGSGTVAALLSMKDTHQYFQRAVCESGNIFNRAISIEQSKKNAQQAFEIMGVNSLDDLMALSDQEIGENYQKALHKALFKSNGTMQRVTDGVLIPENGYKEILNGSASDIDVLVFNTDGEKDYKATDWDVEPYMYAVTDPEVVLKHLRMISGDQKDSGTFWSIIENEEAMAEYFEGTDDPVKRAADLYNDTQFRMTNIFMADALAKNNPNTYMCYWEWAPDVLDAVEYSGEDVEVSPWGRAMHCIELTLTLNNTEGYTELNGDPAKLPANLLNAARETWYAFAKTGDPNNDYINSTWQTYSADHRMMMVVGKDTVWSCQIDPRASDTELLMKYKPSEE